MLKERFSKHFFVIHSFVSDEARQEYLTPPEKRDPPQPQKSELQWAVEAIGEYAQCMQTWCGNDDFFYCHWIAESEDDVYQQLNAFELEGEVVNSRVSEMHQFVSAYRASDEIMRQYPDEGDKWD
ncbi:hypothetical protein N9Y08_01315 [Paracoccaceae bacterium]|jgi:hypothetical protein|nr:hypothetical protein [Paracoccaceae bacterium]MDB2597973.1 hypothetical protein [Paracoccaceae bacterium]MDB2609010.1 hypothetical protein [Paracoccaceae bacterium]